MQYPSSPLRRVGCRSVLALLALALLAAPAQAQISVLTVDCTPFVSPGGSAFGPQNTMGMAVLATGGPFLVTEVTPPAFRALPAAVLSTFDVIAVNNHPIRLGDLCIPGNGNGLGTGWQSVVGVQQCGGRVVLSSHDAPRFHFNAVTPGPPLFTGAEPFGAPGLVRNAVAWAGSGPGTGLVVFNEGTAFVGGLGWGNAALNLPAAWAISDLNAAGVGGLLLDGGYTSITTPGHPVYAGLVDLRFAPFSVSSFSANVGDASYHNVFGSFNAGIFTITEVVVNSGVLDVGGFGVGNNAATVPDGTPITLVRDCDQDGDGVPDPQDVCPNTAIPESVPTRRLGVNRFALVDGDGIFDTTPPNGRGPRKSFTIDDTAGCSCEQIIAALDLGKGHQKFGCSISAMEEWVALVGG